MKNPTPLFKGVVEGGQLKLDNRELFRSYCKNFDGKDVVVSIVEDKPGKLRTLRENKYYWGVVIPILGSNLGYDKDDMHEALKWHFLRDDFGTLPTCKSSAKLTTTEFEDWMVAVRRWAAVEFGLNIPAPNEPFLYGDEIL